MVMLLANPYIHDTRVSKQVRTLSESGCEVHVVCIAKAGLADHEVTAFGEVHRVLVHRNSVAKLVRTLVLGVWSRGRLVRELERAPISGVRVGAGASAEAESGVGEDVGVDAGVAVPALVLPGGPDAPAAPPKLDPIEAVPPAPVRVEMGFWGRVWGWLADWPQRSARRINGVERRILEGGETGMTRLVLRVRFKGMNIVHTRVVRPVGKRASVLDSRARGKLVRRKRALERERAVALVHAQRDAARLTMIRDARIEQAYQRALKLHAIQAARHAAVVEAREFEHGAAVDHAAHAAAVREANRRVEELEAEYRATIGASIPVVAAAAVKPSRLMRWCGPVLRRLPPSVRLVGFNDELARVAVSLEPDLVLSHDANTLLAGALVKRATGAKLVYDSHELYLHRNIGDKRRWVDWLVWWPVERLTIRRADAVFTVAEGIARHLEKAYRIPEVHLLRNLQPFEEPRANEKLFHGMYGLDDSTRVVIYPGAITINRGLEAMIDSAPMLDDAVYVVMGYANNAGYLERLKERARANGSLDKTVLFKDAVPMDQVTRWVASADLGVVPTRGVCLSYRFEASNKMFHCLMVGVPLAMSDHPEKGILARRLGVGALFDETDPASIAACVNGMLGDAEGMERMRANCLRAARELNWEHEEHRYRTIMAGLLGGFDFTVPAVEIGGGDSELVASGGAHVGGLGSGGSGGAEERGVSAVRQR